MEDRKLLHQIRDELVEESHDLSSTFRKALVLSNNLNWIVSLSSVEGK